ncbi:MAG: SUMF1/EgtB/PvdO family nonheme iron enzyme [Alphaproteobacteria bacterium]|nr:SUMF1/EgtB/PvdO family nonheme iron enzyme [Alphaproteobacteria bacterium]
MSGLRAAPAARLHHERLLDAGGRALGDRLRHAPHGSDLHHRLLRPGRLSGRDHLARRDGRGGCPVHAPGAPGVWPDPSPGCTGWRLPTEAEWEYAARGGGEAFAYAGSPTVSDVVHDPGTLEDASCQALPNAYGLCDMSGNYRSGPSTVPTS